MKLQNLCLLAALAVAPAVRAELVNGSFEDPQTNTGAICQVGGVFGYASCGVLPGWSGVFQIGNSGSGFSVPQPYPDGIQALVLQSSGPISSVIQQSFSFENDGTYGVSWMQANRAGYGNQSYGVFLDGIQLGPTITATDTDWNEQFLEFNATAGNHTLMFQTLPADTGDHAVFIDTVSIEGAQLPNDVPEPSSLMLAGAGVVAVAIRRRMA